VAQVAWLLPLTDVRSMLM